MMINNLPLLFFLLTVHSAFGFTSFSLHFQSSHHTISSSLDEVRRSVELDNEENLKALFERAVVLQRSGSFVEARTEYERFIKAAKSTKQEPKTFAEVYNNIAAIELRSKNREMAKHYFKEALKHRKIGKAYVNLALLTLQDGSKSTDPRVGLSALAQAKELCEKALELDEESDQQAASMASKLLTDIEAMKSQMER